LGPPQVRKPVCPLLHKQNHHDTSISCVSSSFVCNHVPCTANRFAPFAAPKLLHDGKHLLTLKNIYLRIFLDCSRHNFVTTKSFREVTYLNFISDGIKFNLCSIKNHGINIYGCVEAQLHAFQTSALDEDERSGSRSSHCPGEQDLGTDRGLCGPQRRVWAVCKKGNMSPPATNQTGPNTTVFEPTASSLYRPR
jgi:hypothetical protein